MPLHDLGVSRPVRLAVGCAIGRMAETGSERATCAWLAQRSARHERHAAAERLGRVRHHCEAIERHLHRHAVNLLSVEHAVTIYD